MRYNSEWEDTPFAVCKVLNTRIATALRPRSYVVQWYGSYASRIRGPYFQGWVDSKDNKVVYTSPTSDVFSRLRRRLTAFTSAHTKTLIFDEHIAILNPRMTNTGRIPDSVLDQLEECPFVNWSRPPVDVAPVSH